MGSPAYGLSRFYWECLDWLFPPVCGGCGSHGSRWCQACQRSVNLISEPICSICGQPLQDNTENLCGPCWSSRPAFSQMRSWAIFDGPLQNALHRLKYKKDIALGDAITCSMMPWFTQLGWQVDLVVPVPLSKERLRARGYNQAAYIAMPMALSQKIEYASMGLARIRDTATQVGLHRTQRRRNVEHAFKANPVVVGGKKVLVIDDVATTGSTIDECARALHEGGASAVYALTVARANKI